MKIDVLQSMQQTSPKSDNVYATIHPECPLAFVDRASRPVSAVRIQYCENKGVDKALLLQTAQTLREEIARAWKDVPKVQGDVADSGCPEDVDINKKFCSRSISDLDFDAAEYCEETPLIYMSKEAKDYFIQAYLLHCLSTEHLNSDYPGSTPCMHVIDELTGRRGIKYRPDYRAEQIQCIIRFLEFVVEHAELYWETDRIGKIRKAIITWRRILEETETRPANRRK